MVRTHWLICIYFATCVPQYVRLGFPGSSSNWPTAARTVGEAAPDNPWKLVVSVQCIRYNLSSILVALELSCTATLPWQVN